ncbi:MAG TPA: RNA polymerase sigma factor [Candidatus Paceibacterota bacterium]|jgi:RNA polymerase sigma-70 factor (ECF subfamily)|nr:RNA polymerase sigma factor [Candidatus Paceibacterota bacterium]
MKANIKEQVEKSFTKACEEHLDALWRYCYFKISDRELAKDLVQETYLRTWNYLSKGEEIQNIRAFFYKTLSNLIIDEYRDKGSVKKSVSLDTMAETGFDPGFDDVEATEDRLDAEQAMKLMQKIPEPDRELIFMRYIQDMSIKEIAEFLKESENNVAVKIHRGLKKVKKIFNQNFNKNL